MAEPLAGKRIQIRGVVQGVGFRPFIYGLANQLKINGWVRNTSGGVSIEVNGNFSVLEQFEKAILENAPALAKIDDLISEKIPSNGYKQFTIIPSKVVENEFQPVCADVSICDDCLSEIFDPEDRHFRYPFTNCTNCGPRYTLIKGLPYDRPQTTMAGFNMCDACAEEYKDPLDRRFHAQPVACPNCGPKIWMENEGGVLRERDEAMMAAREYLREGMILAVKGVGGFHLVCNAYDNEAVNKLRGRKNRIDKPFALMMADIDTVKKHCEVSEKEEEYILSIERPIVILEKKTGSNLSEEIAPKQNSLGVMLPYTPLHYLLLERKSDFPDVLVMTSGNYSEAPIEFENEQARKELQSIADVFLMHDREINTQCDDSVIRLVDVGSGEKPYPIRRSRGYAPFPIRLVKGVPQILATGAELKNTFCLTRDRSAILSPHIGNLDSYETLNLYKKNIKHLEQLFKVYPVAIAHDLHPNYMTTRYANERGEIEGIRTMGIQHHHAHIAACMADNGLKGDDPVIGVSFDGTGYGIDGAVWGGEFLIADYSTFERVSHLEYVQMPGGEKAIMEPYRLALAWMEKLGIEWHETLAPVQELADGEKNLLKKQLEAKINCPLTSSMGRLFDVVSSIAGIRQKIHYEAQGAIELEGIVDRDEAAFYEFDFDKEIYSPQYLIRSVIADCLNGVSKSVISAKFHNGVAEMVRQICLVQKNKTQISKVVLSGGVWQNMTLLNKTLALLRNEGFKVFTHQQVPTNDGGIALGQVMIASRLLEEA